jgi:DHA1 family bicyclomycin/chloramphenicol resistance-like MFS transporter
MTGNIVESLRFFIESEYMKFFRAPQFKVKLKDTVLIKIYSSLMKNKSFTDGKGLIVLLGALTAFDPLSIDMYLPAFSDIQAEFLTSIDKVELSMSAFFIGMAVGQLFYGPLSDRFGRKKPLLAGMFLYLIATIGCAFAPNIETFIVLRVLQALGGCAGMVITRAVIRDLFESKKVADFLSSMALIMGLAPILAPSIGGFVNHLLGWRAIFGLLAVSNVVCLVCIYLFLPETIKQRSSNLSIKSMLTSYGQLFRERSFIGYLIPDTAIRAGMFAYIAGSPFVFIELYNIPKEHYGWIFGMNALGLMAASQINRRLLKHFDSDIILRWSVRVAAVAATVVFLSPQISSQVSMLLIPIFLFLATLNFVGPNALAGALASQGHRAGTASALYGCMQWSLASASSFMVSYFHNGTATPMTGTILACGLISLIAYQILRPQVGDRNQLREVEKTIIIPSEAEPGV